MAVNLARYVIMPAFGVEGEAYLWLLTGFAVVLGHNFPFYLGFKGGKGIATTGGVIFAFHWQLGLICAAVFFDHYDYFKVCIIGIDLHGTDHTVYFVF